MKTIHVKSNNNGGALCGKLKEGDELEKPLQRIFADCKECLKIEAAME